MSRRTGRPVLFWVCVFFGLFFLVEHVHCQTQQFVTAVARTEGFFVKGTLPARLHNPGDIRSSRPHAYTGQVGLYHGYAVFRNDRAGWAALTSQIQRVIDGTSTQYNQAMTFAQIAKIYATSPQWPKTLCKILKISPQLTLEEYFGLAPRVRTVNYDIPLWTFDSRAPMPILSTVPTLSSQVRRTSGRLVGPMPEWSLEETE